MKSNILTTLLVASFLLSGSLAANAGTNELIEKNAKENVRQQIVRNIACPDFVHETSKINQIKALVQVDEKGNVKVEEINSANQQLKAYVVDQLQNMKVKGSGQCQRFVLVINFEVG